jgi:3-isopropylmalate/(R)-2-methylmalate dehydratase small subunit
LIEDFVLNTKPYDQSKILVAGDNFGCGSSREHAPWSLKDFGIRCVISTSFADIFYNNCFQNGILPIVVKAEELDRLMSAAGSQLEFSIDLPNQSIQVGNHSINFEIEDHRKERFLQGLDDIGITLGYKEDIASLMRLIKKIKNLGYLEIYK